MAKALTVDAPHMPPSPGGGRRYRPRVPYAGDSSSEYMLGGPRLTAFEVAELCEAKDAFDAGAWC